ncbi:helix-turn-helix domain-containing protein [Paenibacillus sp. SAFN-054]|uniref:helix-turn-helix domain-containing protein n=1 Tax=Paenibacillus sp. SAFN-054 TaxID=3436865 RepID=UPI003F7DD657
MRAEVNKQQLADSTGYSYQHIYDLLNGKRRWNEDSLEKVLNALGLELNVVAQDTAEDVSSDLVTENMNLKDEVTNLRTVIKTLTKGW